MKPRILLIIILFFLALYLSTCLPVLAIYDPLSVPNNRFGIHLLDPFEIDSAAKLVNSSGGDWGYVTIPIRANDRDLPRWRDFMTQCAKLHAIPILRIASFPSGDHWMAPNEYDLIDFANFLDLLPWPTKNRYVVVYNEPNHDNEWGGFVYPEEYARVLTRAVDILHKKNQDFFVISGGMDESAPNGFNSMEALQYLSKMDQAIPGIFQQPDGMSFHAYGNPAFDEYPNFYSKYNINGYRQELSFIKTHFGITPKIFLTEAGWRRDLVGDNQLGDYFDQAFKYYWGEDVVAVTPFLFSASDGPFQGFSFTNRDGSLYPFAQRYQQLPKPAGKPQLATEQSNAQITAPPSSNNTQPEQPSFFKDFLTKIRSFLRV